MSRATAFCPGHITGFFLPCEHTDPLRSGSRGAGLCVDRGVTSMVTVRPGTGQIVVTVDGSAQDGAVTVSAVRNLLGNERKDVEVVSRQGLPCGAGFGMSAAGALSAATATAELLGRPIEEAFVAAHRAELSNRTGLGDVAALTQGGLTFRRREGLPPHGKIDRLASSLEIVAAVVGGGVRTADVLSDREGRERILKAGGESYRDLEDDPTVEGFFRASRQFTERSGLASHAVSEAMEAVKGLGQASMVMLGNSVFACGDLEAIEERWRRLGPTYRLALDTKGPRLMGDHS